MAAYAGHWNEPEHRAAGRRPFHHVGIQCRRSDGFPADGFVFQFKRKEHHVMDIKHVFVYGTLKKGERNHDHFCGDALTIEPAVTTGRLYQTPYGFPAIIDAPDGQVFGEVMTFPDITKTLQRLDRLEGYRPGYGESHYIRIEKTVIILNNGKVVHAWVYVYPKERCSLDNIFL